MWKMIREYQLIWRANESLGVIYLKMTDGTIAKIEPESVVALAALGDILRNEKPVFFHTESGSISTGWEPTGEDERR
jgi:hypothetical protein